MAAVAFATPVLPAAAPVAAAPASAAGLARAGAPKATAGNAAGVSTGAAACAAGAALAMVGQSSGRRQALAGRKARQGKGRRAAVALKAEAEEIESPPPCMEIDGEDPSSFVLGVLGDLHLDPRDMDHSYEAQGHFKKIFEESPTKNKFLASLGDLGESKDCTQTKQLFSGTTECFKLAREYLDGYGVPFDVVGGNHDLEGIDEFGTDEENLEAYLKYLGKETPQFCHEIAEKVLVVGLGSTAFRTATYTSHEVTIDAEQLKWFEKTIEEHPASEGWQIFCFSHAPIIGSALRVLQENHVVNGCCWLNHTDAVSSKKFIEVVRSNSCVKAWFSGHFHLSHDYEDSITFPGGNNRGSCVFAQVGCMTARSSRDTKRMSRFVRGNSTGFEVCTVDHLDGGKIRLDATVTYSDECVLPDSEEMMNMEGELACSTITYAHKHEFVDTDQWFKAYVPQENDSCFLMNPDGTINEMVDNPDMTDKETVCWWHMKDGAVLGVHNGMVIEYDPSTLAPLGMVVSRDELVDRKVAVIDDEWGGSALVLYDEDSNDVTVVQPNEDGSYWRKVVRNKMHRMKEMRRNKAAKNWMSKMRGEDAEPADINVLNSYGPYKTTAGQVMGLTTKAINPKAAAHA